MKWSKYNFLYKSQKHNIHLLYNSLSNSFIKLDDNNVLSAILLIKENINNFDFTNNIELFNQLKKSFVIVESDEMEVLKIKHGVLQNRYSPFTMIMTILPTLSCNFKCPYCFESGESNSYMNLEVENRIIKHIQYNIENNKVLNLNLCWMGGEPLLNFKRMKSLTQKIKKLNIKLNSFLITNGYLLTKEKIHELENLNIKLIQITLDGIENEHNRTRIHKSKNETFSRIINNIENIFSVFSEQESVNINIRVNLIMNEDYINKFIKIYRFLRKKFPYKNLHISPGFVGNIGNDGQHNGCDFDRSLVKDFFLKISQKYSLKDYSPYPKNYLTECAVRSQNAITIGPKAEIYACWDNIGNKAKVIGQIDENGLLKITDENTYIKYLAGADYLNEPKCLKCFFFPICNGGCPEKRIKNLYEGTSFDCCSIQKNNLEEILDCHYVLKSHTTKKIYA